MVVVRFEEEGEEVNQQGVEATYREHVNSHVKSEGLKVREYNILIQEYSNKGAAVKCK